MTTLSRKKVRVHSEEERRFALDVVGTAGILDEETATRLFEAFASVPRATFLSDEHKSRASEDARLSIGFGQLSLRPSLVARMLGLLGIAPGMRILEVGSGSGYTSSLMASVGAQVYAVETIGLLAQQTRRHLDASGFSGVLITTADARRGWKEHAPYDGIVVWFPLEEISSALLSDLAPRGRLVALVGAEDAATLTLFERRGADVVKYALEPVKLSAG